MIRKHNRRAAKAAFAISLGVAIVIGLAVAVVARPAEAKQTAGPTVIVGSKNFPEEDILGQLYTQALKAKGFSVQYKSQIGSTELMTSALQGGKINFYPEYTGVIVQDVFHHTFSPKTAAATYQLAKKLESGKGYTLLSPTPFYDTDVLAVTNATASKYGLSKASFLPLAGISAYAALDAGKVLAADVFSTDPPLAKPSKYTVLTDPKHITGFQNVAPIVKTSIAQEAGADFTKTVNAVSAKLTLPAIIAMNKAVIIDKKNPATVAGQFLKANGLA